MNVFYDFRNKEIIIMDLLDNKWGVSVNNHLAKWIVGTYWLIGISGDILK